MTKATPALQLAALMAAVALTACGGGGGDSAPATTAPVATTPTAPAPTPAPTPSTPTAAPTATLAAPAPVAAPAPATASTAIVTSVPAATYATGSPERAAYELINQERARCGFGLQAQNAALDRAAVAHANYLLVNNSIGHTQIAGNSGFTGIQPWDRAIAAGYGSNQVYEVISYPIAASAVRRLLSVPYHALSFLNGSRDIGMSLTKSATETYGKFVFKQGITLTMRLQQSEQVQTYPCEGTDGVLPIAPAENPSPFPGNADQSWGQPIYVVGSANMTIQSATITGPQGPVAIRAVYGDGQATDPNGLCRAGRACVIPTMLVANTGYSVSITGTDRGVAFSRAFTFRTGAAVL